MILYYTNTLLKFVLKAVAAEAGMAGMAAQPAEQAGMTTEVIQKLQEKATVLTQERKKRGRTVPEDLIGVDAIRGFHTISSHPVSTDLAV